MQRQFGQNSNKFRIKSTDDAFALLFLAKENRTKFVKSSHFVCVFFSIFFRYFVQSSELFRLNLISFFIFELNPQSFVYISNLTVVFVDFIGCEFICATHQRLVTSRMNHFNCIAYQQINRIVRENVLN